MRIGFVELVLLLFIASITVGPNVALFANRWLRRAQRTSAAAARRKAQLEAQAAIEREALMTRFRVASNIFALLMLAALAYGLLLRPIDTPPKAYTAPDVRQDTGAAQTALSADSKDGWKLGGYLGVDCVRTQDGLVYAAAYNGAAMKKRQSDLVRTDGGHYAAILSVEGELTGFAFDADGDLWLTVVTPSGGALCRARHDSWGTSVEQVVTQIDGAPLGVLSAVETGPDGKVYFAVSTEAAAKNGLESALRTELIAHTGTGCVYVYDPSARTVEQVLGGVAGAAGLALSEDGRTLYVSDLGNRCIWSVDADARELTAGGKNCGSFVSGLPGYPGALALDEDGVLYISYRWTRSGWLEKHADSTLLRVKYFSHDSHCTFLSHSVFLFRPFFCFILPNIPSVLLNYADSPEGLVRRALHRKPLIPVFQNHLQGGPANPFPRSHNGYARRIDINKLPGNTPCAVLQTNGLHVSVHGLTHGHGRVTPHTVYTASVHILST